MPVTGFYFFWDAGTVKYLPNLFLIQYNYLTDQPIPTNMSNLFYSYIPVLFTFLIPANSFFNKINIPIAVANYFTATRDQQNKEDEIIGKWMTTQKNLTVEVYKQNNNFKAKMIWFKIEDTTRPQG